MYVLLAIDPSIKQMGWAIFVKDAHDDRQSEKSLEKITTSSLETGHEDRPHAHPDWELAETGVIIAHDRPWRVDLTERIKAIQEALDNIAEAWLPREAARGTPAPIKLPNQQEGIEILGRSLERWSESRNLPLYSYTVREIRTALLGRSKPAKEELAYAAMTRWGLLGTGKNTHEWNAIAVGDYHLERRKLKPNTNN